MKILIACETSGVIRRAFRKAGHFAMSCDLRPCQDNSPYHYQDDVRNVLHLGWDMMIAHPDCTYLCSSGMHWTTRGLRDPKLTEDAVDFFRFLLEYESIPRRCIENPVGCISTRIRKPDQYIQPYQFGEDASKKTGLWLVNLPNLIPTKYIEPRWVFPNGRDSKPLPRWGNQTDSGQNKLPPSKNRWQIRSDTYPGIARAMLEQWGKLNSISYGRTNS